MKSYTLHQLNMVGLMAFRGHWMEALEHANFTEDEVYVYSRYLVDNKICKFLTEYCLDVEELEKFNLAVTFLVNKYSLDKED